MMRLRAFFLLFLLLIVLAGCSFGFRPQQKPYKETQFLMDTIIEITAYGPKAEPAVKAAFAEFQRLHDITNNFDEHSQVSEINRSAGVAPVKVDSDLIRMVQRSNELSNMLDGAFDVTIGPLTDLWGIGRKGDFVPTEEEINRALSLVNYRLVQVDGQAGTIFLPHKGMLMDLGGIAKGYATDRAIEKLRSFGIESALVNAGGDVRVIGVKPDGNAWRIGVQDPRNNDGMIAKLSLTEWDTMETSGDYQRFFEKSGIRYSHILDPRTGHQPRELSSVTMVLSSSADGDILSTGLFVLGEKRGMQALEKIGHAEAIMAASDGRIIYSPGLAGKLELVAK